MSSIQNKVDASFFIFWLRSRQDTIDIASHIIADDTINDPLVLKEHLAALFNSYADDSTSFAGYCKNKIDEDRVLLQQNATFEAQIQSLREYQARLIKSVDHHKEELRIHRLDAADFESALEFQKKSFSAMKYYFDRQQKIRDKAHDSVLAETQARLETLQTENDSLRVQHEDMKLDLAESQMERNALSEKAAHAAGLERALKAAYDTNDRLLELADNLTADDALLASTMEADMMDSMTDTEDDGETEEEEEDQTVSSMTLVPHSLSSPSRSLCEIEWV
ncbi:hypothetical protein PG993_011712 [Apiospora rasikravindrae]|uniref:Uncharacterized protein n=1 Tax=Apiospora rasikravindrae TaxID=990691 RepID=A0ABR1S1Z9_9PEZI